MKKVKIFEENQYLITTPMLSSDCGSSIACVEVYINEYGKVVVSATNDYYRETGYFAFPLEIFFDNVSEEALTLIANSLNNEIKKRSSQENSEIK